MTQALILAGIFGCWVFAGGSICGEGSTPETCRQLMELVDGLEVRPSCPQPWSCASADTNLDGIVGPPDLEDCNRLTGIEAKACTVLVQAWGGERCP